MEKYKNLHLWMILPFVLMQLGFIQSYWITWSQEYWVHHMHALSAMAWFALLMIQPYLATRGKMDRHRTWGMIGFFIAGATAWSAIAILPMDVEYGDYGGFGAYFPAEFFYGIVLVELIMMIGFCIAVIMAIVHRKNTESHALWLISSVFYILHPGFGRALMGLFFGMEWSDQLITPVSWAAIIIIAALVIFGWRQKKLKHPAILLGILVNIPSFFAIWLGQQPAYVNWIKGLMKYMTLGD